MIVMGLTLPQRFQIVNGLSNLDAGIRLLPFGGSFPVGAVLSANAASKCKVPGPYLVMLGAAIQVVGFALLGRLKAAEEIDIAMYGYQVLCGVGTGMSYQILYLMVPFVAEQRDKGLYLSTDASQL